MYNIQPSEYRDMSPHEVMRIVEINRPKNIGSLHEDDYNRIEERRAELEAEGVNVL